MSGEKLAKCHFTDAELAYLEGLIGLDRALQILLGKLPPGLGVQRDERTRFPQLAGRINSYRRKLARGDR